MEGLSPDLGRTPDGGTLRRLPNGLEIVRRQKHEPIMLGAGSSDIASRTDKKSGSKFVSQWGLDRVTNFLEKQLLAPGCPLKPLLPGAMTIRAGEPIGIVGGDSVQSVRIVSDGRYVHAYPVEDAP